MSERGEGGTGESGRDEHVVREGTCRRDEHVVTTCIYIVHVYMYMYMYVHVAVW